MAKFCGKIGFGVTAETSPGVWTETIEERLYYGDVLRNTRQLQNSGGVNDDIAVSNEISIISDPYANRNFHAMRYVEFMGAKWKISAAEVQYPRLILTVGGLYNAD